MNSITVILIVTLSIVFYFNLGEISCQSSVNPIFFPANVTGNQCAQLQQQTQVKCPVINGTDSNQVCAAYCASLNPPVSKLSHLFLFIK